MYKIILIIFFPVFLFAQTNYNVESIPEDLKKNADAVVRLKETIFTIEDLGSAIEEEHMVVTVFNDRGAAEYSKFYTHYDKLSKIKSIEGGIYDAKGNRLSKLKKENIIDVSYDSFSNSVTDNRQRIAQFDNKSYSYPYTIEFHSVVKTKNMMFYPRELFYASRNVSIEKQSLFIMAPLNFSFRYKEMNMPNVLVVTEKEKQKTYNWTVENMAATKYESYVPDHIYPMVLTAPKEFEVEGYAGNIDTWNDVGKFIWTLNKNRDELPEAIKLKVKELVGTEKDTLKKIELLYNYLQSNTRYMSIQLGIGGWQTIPAIEVANKGYGDCKALSNYMKALLSESGIKAYIALISADADAKETIEEFPSMSFNHVIACIPLAKDTVWLECTSQNNAMGYLGDFTGNRKALLILPNGGKLVNTTRYRSFENTRNRKATVFVDKQGNAKAQVKTMYSGIQQESKFFILHYGSKDDQKRYLQNDISIPSFELEKFSFKEIKSRVPVIEESLELKINKIVNQSGSRYFIKPNLMSDDIQSNSNDANRRSPFVLDPNQFNYSKKDTIVFNLPENYFPEFFPEPVSIKSKFGEYSTSCTIQGQTLVYCRALTINSGIFPAADFKEWNNFLRKIDKNDRLQIAFKLKSE